MGPLWIELLIAGVVSLGAIVVVRAIITPAIRRWPTIKHFANTTGGSTSWA